MPSSTTSDFLHHAQMKELFHGVNFTILTDLYVALFTTNPTLDGTGGVEVSTSGTNYQRVQVPVSASEWNVNGLEYSNANDITYGVPSANWGTIVGSGLYDAATGGNLLYVSPLTVSKVVSNGDGAPKILVGQLRTMRASC